MKLRVPQALAIEHRELHAQIEAAVKSAGETGAAARALVEAVRPHFLKEEKYALRPLGALATLAKGKLPPGARFLQAQSEQLREYFPTMLAEHRRILAAAKRLAAAARKERKLAHVRFAARLQLHVQAEETVLYPAAILIGDYLRLRSSPWAR